MKIAIDIDDVLCDTIPALVKFFNKHYKPRITQEKLQNYSYWGFLGKTREEANEKYFSFIDSKEFLEARPVEGAVPAIKELAKTNELYLVTGRPYFTKEKTGKWVNDNFPKVFKEVYFTNNRLDKEDYTPYWGRAKAEICKEIGIEVLIDDLLEYVRESESLTVYLLDRYWNQGSTRPHIIRIKSWPEIVNNLNSLALK